MTTEVEYWEAIEKRICAKCVDGDGLGECRIGDGRECALRTSFPQIIEAINAAFSSSIEPYEEQLREKVCRVCTHQSGDGSCRLRDDVACALDRYFPMIVEVIEETQLKRRLHVG
jgi:hypothetical protein